MRDTVNVSKASDEELRRAIQVFRMFGRYADAEEFEAVLNLRREVNDLFGSLRDKCGESESEESEGLCTEREEKTSEGSVKEGQPPEEPEERELTEEREQTEADFIRMSALQCSSYDDAVELGYVAEEVSPKFAMEIEQYIISKLPEIYRRDVERYGEDE